MLRKHEFVTVAARESVKVEMPCGWAYYLYTQGSLAYKLNSKAQSTRTELLPSGERSAEPLSGKILAVSCEIRYAPLSAHTHRGRAIPKGARHETHYQYR